MKRFIVFAGWDHESSGGAEDIVGDYWTLEEALRAHAPLPADWWGHALDTHTGYVTQIPGPPRERCEPGRIAGLPKCDPMPGAVSEIVFAEREPTR